ncbi:MAG: YbaK/EbsC family protein [Lachnospiraceae bacterium]|nr:YbaK/EbsC family protein [Robinsoniella sp.]MDY3767281.1 YbaK/EbsC family protein [Lachnospiraceae bacterium]
MSVEKVREYLKSYGVAEKVREFDESSATVELAAHAVGVIPARIAKTLSFKKEDHCILVVTAGDQKIDNPKFKKTFGMKAKMLTADEVISMTGHAIGGVCPFAVPDEVEVYLDESMRRFETIFPAAGSSSSAVELTCEELEECSKARAWVDVCKPMA